MDYRYLLIEQSDKALIVRINRPEALNAINSELMRELNHFFKKDVFNYAISGIILTGVGEKAFVAGADIKELESLSPFEAENLSSYGHGTYFAIERCHVPVIAVVKGFALGGGCELAMACHLRIAGPKAKFGQPEVNLGLPPGYGGTQRLVHLVGKSKALQLLLTTEMVDAQEAFRIGLVNYLVEENQELSKAQEIISLISTKAPIAVAKVIECVNACIEKETDGYYHEAASFGYCSGTQDFKEGTSAFVEKRKAAFIGK